MTEPTTIGKAKLKVKSVNRLEPPIMTEPITIKETGMKIWECKIGECNPEQLPDGADSPMRNAVAEAYEKITGKEADFCFSGWGAELTPEERAVVDETDWPVPPPTTDELIAELCERGDVIIEVQTPGKIVEEIIGYDVVGDLSRLLERVKEQSG